MTLQEICDRLQARKLGVGAHWKARCPVHEGRSLSLSIGEGRDGRVLLHCFAGCTTDSVCAALGITVSDLFAGPGTFTPRPQIVRDVEQAVKDDLWLTPWERECLDVTVVQVDHENFDAGIARALALAVDGELVQAVLVDHE